MRARLAVVLALAVVASAAVPTVAGSSEHASVNSTHDADASRTTAFEAPDDRPEAGTITEVITLHRLPTDPGTVEVTLSYRIPDDVTELEVRSRFLSDDDVDVASVDGFDRRSVRRFVWDESTDAPTITLTVGVGTDSFGDDDVGVETDDWAFTYLPDPYVNWRYRGDAPAFETTHTVATEGHATNAFGVAGNVSRRTRTAGDANLTLVVPDDARLQSSFEELVELYRVGGRELQAGFSYENATVFVLPARVFERRSPVGTAVAHSVWVQDEYSAIETVENTPAHEYVHTRMGTFRASTGRWLTEASAEYYGAVLSMNTETGNWTSFRASLEVDRESVRESSLARPRSWTDAYVPYSKGSRVLAALDAEIRDRTDGEKSFQDVLAYRFEDDAPYGNLDTYEDLGDAVVAVTDDPGMRDWLDRYVAGNEVPPLPDDPGRFVLNESMDSDGDGVENGQEVATNPFDPDSDDDGVADGEDAFPMDSSRSEPADVSTTATSESTTVTQTTVERTTTEPTRTASGTSPDRETDTASTEPPTPTRTMVSSTASVDDTDETPDDETTDVEMTEGDGPDADGETPGFGVAVALLANASVALVAWRRSSH